MQLMKSILRLLALSLILPCLSGEEESAALPGIPMERKGRHLLRLSTPPVVATLDTRI